MRENIYRMVLDELPEYVHVVNCATHEVLYMNASASKAFGHLQEQGARLCYELFRGRTEPCLECSEHAEKLDGFATDSFYDERTSQHFLLHDCMVDWGDIPARLEIAFDVTDRMDKWVDPLTGMGSRAAFFQNAADFYRTVGVMVTDLDCLAQINKQQGREAGDKLIAQVAEVLEAHFGREMVYRIGDDEFCAVGILPDRRDFVDRVTAVIKTLCGRGLSASVGYAYSEEACEASSLVPQAADLMRRAKRGRAVLRNAGYDPDSLKGACRLFCPGAAAQAVKAGEFVVWLQPQVRAATREVVGAEALVRYVDPETGELVAPFAFIPALEDMGDICEVDFFVFEQVCAATARWSREGFPECRLSTNFSRRTVELPGFADKLYELVQRYGVVPPAIELELTESAREEDPAELAAVVDDLRKRGFLVAIDDFGTEQANMSLFTTLEFDVLKLDKSLIDAVDTSPRVREVVQALLAVCERLGIESVAEGIESEEQMSTVRDAGCSRIQGYLTGRPMPLEEFEEHLRSEDGHLVIEGAPGKRLIAVR